MLLASDDISCCHTWHMTCYCEYQLLDFSGVLNKS